MIRLTTRVIRVKGGDPKPLDNAGATARCSVRISRKLLYDGCCARRRQRRPSRAKRNDCGSKLPKPGLEPGSRA